MPELASPFEFFLSPRFQSLIAGVTHKVSHSMPKSEARSPLFCVIFLAFWSFLALCFLVETLKSTTHKSCCAEGHGREVEKEPQGRSTPQRRVRTSITSGREHPADPTVNLSELITRFLPSSTTSCPPVSPHQTADCSRSNAVHPEANFIQY